MNETKNNNLLSDAELYQDSYTNYALKFDGNDDFIKINNSSDINIGSHHTIKQLRHGLKLKQKYHIA
ncbi:hypothetical protein Ct9H90mP29_20150 [bacterium]|nr:MAG: hypothetical protein Ct9H90mP29_20150 [bacterium]